VAAHVAALELVRLPVAGPTVDGIHLDTTDGIVGFVTGRGFHGLLLVVVPAAVGVVYGAGAARRSTGRRWAADSTPLTGSIAEFGTARVGGHDTSLLLRGRSAAAPVLLYLAGGPGGTEMGSMHLFGEPLERDFVVGTWDQRGAGTSYGALDPTSTLTFDQAFADTIELTEQLRVRSTRNASASWASRRDTERALLATERAELEQCPEEELAELAGLHRAKGISARRRATRRARCARRGARS